MPYFEAKKAGRSSFDYHEWMAAGGVSGSYQSLSVLLNDEEAVRRLMTIHAAVDYLANFSALDASVNTIINDNLCAKWITLRDYAEDVLTAAYGGIMETAGKYGFGEWAKINNVWQAKGNVPVMTSNSAPYGTASAYQVFDNNFSTTASGTDFSYQFTNPVCVRRFTCKNSSNVDISGGTLQYSDDGSAWTSISTPASNTGYHLYYRVHFTSSQTVAEIQFYGRELIVSVPVMTGNDAPYGHASSPGNYDLNTIPCKAFDNNDSTYYLSDFNRTISTWYLKYEFIRALKAKKAHVVYSTNKSSGTPAWFDAQIEASSDGSAWTAISSVFRCQSNTSNVAKSVDLDLTTNSDFKYYRIVLVDGEFDKAHVNNSHRICIHTLQLYGEDYSEYDWDQDNPRHYLYDHGVELETIKEGTGSEGGTIEKQSYQIKLATPNSGSLSGNKYAGIFVAKDFTNYNLGRIVMGNINGTSDTTNNYIVDFLIATKDSGVGSNKTMPDQGIAKTSIIQPFYTPYCYSLDISSINGEYDIGITVNFRLNRYGTITEWWLE